MPDADRETQPAPPPRGGPVNALRRSRLARWILLAFVVLVMAAAVFVWRHNSVRESTDDAQLEGDITPVSARVGGAVRAVLVEDNQFVEAGQPLVELDPTDYEVALRRAEADLADAEGNAKAAETNVPITVMTTDGHLAATHAQLVAARKDVDAARARVAEAEAQFAKASADLSRFKELVQKDEISRQQYDAAVAAEAAARASLDSSRAALAAAEAHAAEADAQVRAARSAPDQQAQSRARANAAAALVLKNRAAVQQAQLNLTYTKIIAPTAGVVSRKAVQVGQVVQAGQPLLAIVPLDRIWVVANFKENQLRRMRPGQPATVHVDAYGRDYRGRVQSIGGATAAKFSLLPPENATGNYIKVVQRVPVKIVFEPGQDPERRLRPGLSVVPTVITK